MPDHRETVRRQRMQAMASGVDRDKGFRLEATTGPDAAPETPRLYLYSEIGGMFGVWPEEVVESLKDVQSGVELHIHSPGGDAFDGIALYNAFRDHDRNKGPVAVEIDGLAASAASVLAMAGRRVKMRPGAQLMIHDAWGMTIGPADEQRRMAEDLDRTSDAIAEIYAARAGGEPKAWREAMRAETWYRGAEAVEAGLADEIETSREAAKNRWELGQIFAHAGRDAAPDPAYPAGRRHASYYAQPNATDGAPSLPVPPPIAPDVSPAGAAIRQMAAQTAVTETPDATPAAGSTPTSEEVSGVPVADPTKLREALGLAADASDDDVRAAYAAAFATPPAPPEADQSDPTSALLSAIPQDGNAIVLDRENYKALVEMAKRGDIAHEAMKRGERDTFLKEACKAGRFQPSRLDHYKEMWDRNPDETRAFVNLMPPNSVPVTAAGSYGVDVDMNEADLAYAAMYPGEAR
jgi:ATP-dependent protease ClpP protease subunit